MLGGVLLALAVLLAAAGWLDAGSAGPLAWLAQVPAALGVAHVRGTREGRPQLRDAWGLLLLWGGAFLLAAALAALPLSRLLAAPSLGATLGLSAAAGIVLVVVWRHWPALLRGESVALDFLVPSRLETLGFKLRRIGSERIDGAPATVFRLSLGGLLGLFAPDIEVGYRDADRRLMRFEGLTNIRADRDDNLVARIAFPPARERAGVDAAAWAAALAEPLGACRLSG